MANLVLSTGIEPVLDYSKQILSLARLPIPPREPISVLTRARGKCKGGGFKPMRR